jgi:hypothetical protein
MIGALRIQRMAALHHAQEFLRDGGPLIRWHIHGVRR